MGQAAVPSSPRPVSRPCVSTPPLEGPSLEVREEPVSSTSWVRGLRGGGRHREPGCRAVGLWKGSEEERGWQSSCCPQGDTIRKGLGYVRLLGPLA